MEDFAEIFYNLAFLRLTSVVKSRAEIPKGYMPCSVPGSSAILALKIEVDTHITNALFRMPIKANL